MINWRDVRRRIRIEEAVLGHVQVSKLIPAKASELFRYIAELRSYPDSLGPKTFTGFSVDFPSAVPILRESAEFEATLTRFGMSSRFQGRVDVFEPNHKMTYVQANGFFREWSHSQILTEHDSNLTLMTDLVDFKLPLGLLGAFADDILVRNDITRTLSMRQIRIEDHFRNLRALDANVESGSKTEA